MGQGCDGWWGRIARRELARGVPVATATSDTYTGGPGSMFRPVRSVLQYADANTEAVQ